ncbi:MAG: hypothetical protein KW788_02275 [Candidatus Doudnabacteria bacterium]|nr:hypothetical protein [Candidatus Doudnabacteria bacterium]
MDFLNPKIGRSSHDSAREDQAGGTSAHSVSSLFSRLINYCLLALVLLIPLFYLPITSETREFNKQHLIILGLILMLVAWVIKILTTRSVSWVKTPLDFAVLGFGAVYLISSFFSIDKASSFLGYWGRFSGSAISVLALVLMYFLIVNNIRSQKVTHRILDLLTLSSGLVSVMSLLLMFNWFPFGELGRSFNTVGSMVALSIFSALAILVYQWQMWAHPQASMAKQAYWGVLTVLALVVMFMLNAFIGWLVLALSMIVFMALGMVMSHSQSQNWFWKPMLVLVAAILFVALQVLPNSINPRNIVNINLPIEIQLSNSATFNLVSNSLKGGVKPAALGSGPGTTGIAFGQIKPSELNKTVIWSLNFDRASSEFANILIETGILGLLAFEAVSILFLLYGIFFLLRQVNHPGRMYAFAFFMIWAALFITHFFYFFNTTFYFLYWLSIALFMAIVHWNHAMEEEANMNFSSSPRAALSWMFASLLMLALILVGAFFEASVYVAEASYTTGVKILNQADPDFTRAQNNFARAASLNPYRDVYHLANAQNMIFLSSIEAAKKEPNIQQINTWIAGAVDQGRQATEISPSKASNWSARAQIYNAIRPLGVQGTAKAASDAWLEAIKHDDRNPALYVQLAAAYVDQSTVIDPSILGTGADADQDGLSDDSEAKLKSDPNNSDTNGNGFSDGDEVKAGFNPAGAGRLSDAVLKQFSKTDNALLKQAEDALNKAIELKNDLPDPYIAKARVFEAEKRLPDAKTVLDKASAMFPFNPNIRFEQGRITYNSGDPAAAEKIFNDVLKLQPKHADSLFSLGLIYESKDKVKALEYYKKVREITGPNVDLDKRINDIQQAIAAPSK